MPENSISTITKFIKRIGEAGKWIYHYSGVKYIVRKFYPPKDSDILPTGFIWLFGIYIALFGIAFDRYEDRASEIDNLINSLTAQLYTEKGHYALSRIPDIQWQPCPFKPSIFNPKTVFFSLFGEDKQYEEMANYLKSIIVDHRNKLNSLNLGYIDLRGTLFHRGNFKNTKLLYSKLDQAFFMNVDFENADFFNATFVNAWFNDCKFKGANLNSVNFEGTFFLKCNLEDATGIKIEQLVKCKSLFECRLRPSWLKVLKRDYPQKLEWPDGYSMDEMSILKNRVFPAYFEKIYKEHSSD